jgi:hypothetical protein
LKQILKTFILLSFFVSFSFAQNPFIINDGGLIDKRAEEKIFQIGSEVKAKLNVNLYVDVQQDNGLDIKLPRKERIAKMRQLEQEKVKNLKKPYAVLAISIEQLYASILMSDDVKKILDKDDILDGYVIPLLASKDKNTLFAKTSAAVLNGYAQMADSLAESRNIKLQSSIGSGGKIASTIWKMVMYTIVLFGIIFYAIIIMRERKFKKKGRK